MRCAGRCVDESRHSRPLRTLATYCGLPHPNSICAQDGGGGYGGMFGDEAYFRRAPESARACAHSHQEVARELLRVGRGVKACDTRASIRLEHPATLSGAEGDVCAVERPMQQRGVG